MNIHESAEDYLETILMLQEKNGAVRSIDIASELNVTRPSVSYAMKRLRENGYIEMDRANLITLTESGMEIARKVYTTHKLITKFLMQLGVNASDARLDAGKIEHDISPATLEAFKRQLEAI